MTDTSEFAAWLRDSLDERGISQRQLAHRSGVHHSTICRLLKGGRVPSHRTARRLTEVLEGTRADVRALSALLRRDPYLADQDITRIVDLYTDIRVARGWNSDRRRPMGSARIETRRPLVVMDQSGPREERYGRRSQELGLAGRRAGIPSTNRGAGVRHEDRAPVARRPTRA